MALLPGALGSGTDRSTFNVWFVCLCSSWMGLHWREFLGCGSGMYQTQGKESMTDQDQLRLRHLPRSSATSVLRQPIHRNFKALKLPNGTSDKSS